MLLRFLQRNATVLDGKTWQEMRYRTRKPLTVKALARRGRIERDAVNRISRPVP